MTQAAVTHDDIIVPVGHLKAFGIDVLVRSGIPSGDAAKIIDLMVDADLTGAEAHGMYRLPQYVKRIRAGGVNKTPNITVNRTAAATALVDGDNGMGHLVMSRAGETAVKLAQDSGVGWVGVRGSNHAGPAALYAEMPVAHGMVGIYSAVASANHMAIWGGSDSLLGTNPLAIAIPAGEEPPIVLDMATTIVSYGTVKASVLNGKGIAPGWMIDKKTGEALLDADRLSDGLLLPIGGYKGSGLAMVLGFLAGTLNDAVFGRDVVDFNYDDTTVTNTGHFILALDIARFVDPARFGAEIDRHIRDLKASTPLPGQKIRMPGERRGPMRAEGRAKGVSFTPAVLARLNQMARDVGAAELDK
ncbi:lactate dehydrogenase [Terrihabitans soli]|uniref:Lactate dehydrogenase n=1 Tax=Terrihabitans soli TaxID=708113 RepID=A0A6S6QPS6_9HYPH|nr:Ldh family oxidoreductase [Terrihabitans soli]BCJ89947.1 lactate dehydrogenase [Terrihabitans soli]